MKHVCTTLTILEAMMDEEEEEEEEEESGAFGNVSRIIQVLNNIK